VRRYIYDEHVHNAVVFPLWIVIDFCTSSDEDDKEEKWIYLMTIVDERVKDEREVTELTPRKLFADHNSNKQ
jgi:hypothetical protein